MIDLQHIDVIFETPDRTVAAVQDVNLKVNKGEIFGIVGYSGAGKSTLVRTINLLQRPTRGEVIVNGHNLTQMNASDLRQARKKIGMIFQHFNLMGSRTIFDNVAFPLKRSGLSKEEIKNRVIELLTLVGLSDKLDDYPSQLSGGQKQRVAIARALANDPEVLLCDEATSALDPKTTQSILALLRRLNEELGLTIVIITHEMAVVKELCHRVAVMENGQVLEKGSIVDIFTQPERALTREFINTATHFDQEISLILQQESIEDVLKESELARLSYVGEVTTQPLVAELIKEFDIETNILYGNIEVLQGVPVGNLLVSFTGNLDHLQQAKEHLISRGVKVQGSQSLFKQYVKTHEEGEF